MAHTPGEGYNAQGAREAKAAKASKVSASSGSGSGAGAAGGSASSAPAAAAGAMSGGPPTGPGGGGGGWSVPVPMPDPTDWSIPGGNVMEKALVVLGVLIVGLGIYSRVTGHTVNLSLPGFAPLSQPPLAPTMSSRTTIANPAKVGA